MADYWPAPELAELAAPLIADHYPDLTTDPGSRIFYCWRDKAALSHGRYTLGTCSLVTGRAAMLVQGALTGALTDRRKNIGFDDHSFFVIEIARSTWVPLTEDQQLALLDHELAHCKVVIEYDDNDREIARTLDIRDHDIEEFEEIVERHGLWNEDLESFAHALKQAPKPPQRRRARRPEQPARPAPAEALGRYDLIG